MSPQLIMAAILAAAGFLGGWTLQSWRYGAKERDRAEQALVDQRLSTATALRRTDNVLQVQNDATEREAVLRDAADAARSTVAGMRNTLSRTLRDAAASQSACIDRATALSELLASVEEAGAGLAEKAGRHANDATTCHDAWPK